MLKCSDVKVEMLRGWGRGGRGGGSEGEKIQVLWCSFGLGSVQRLEHILNFAPRFESIPPIDISQDYNSDQAQLGARPRMEIQNRLRSHPTFVSSHSHRHFNISTSKLLQHLNISTLKLFQHFNISTLKLLQHFNIEKCPLLCKISTFQHLHFSTFQHFNLEFNIQP